MTIQKNVVIKDQQFFIWIIQMIERLNFCRKIVNSTRSGILKSRSNY